MLLTNTQRIRDLENVLSAGRREDGLGGRPPLYIVLVGSVVEFALMASGLVPNWSAPSTLPSGVGWLALLLIFAMVAWCYGRPRREAAAVKTIGSSWLDLNR